MSDAAQNATTSNTPTAYPWQSDDHMTFIEQRRATLTEVRESLNSQISECRKAANAQIGTYQKELAATDREWNALAEFKRNLTGRGARASSNAGATANATTRQPRAGSKRAEIHTLIHQSGTEGLKRSEIIDRMGLKGNTAGEMSVSNALTALAKNNTVKREGGQYFSLKPPTGEVVTLQETEQRRAANG